MTQTPHELCIFLTSRFSTGVALEPFAESSIQGCLFVRGPQPGAFDQVFLGAQSDISHVCSVHYFSVHGRRHECRRGTLRACATLFVAVVQWGFMVRSEEHTS